MKYTIATALMPLAMTAARGSTLPAADYKFAVTGFEARCMQADMYTDGRTYCLYDFTPVLFTSDHTFDDDPYFGLNCGGFMPVSEDGDLPSFEESDCGSFKVAVTKMDNGGLELAMSFLKPYGGGITGRYVISPQELLRTTYPDDEDDGALEETVQEYVGPTDFTVTVNEAYVAPAPKSTTMVATTNTLARNPALATETPAPTRASLASLPTATFAEPSTTPTVASTSSPASPSETNSGAREIVSVGVLRAAVLIALVF
ncbi:hypothetical protein PG984_016470 [Apiospora sp. TS-2023a]